MSLKTLFKPVTQKGVDKFKLLFGASAFLFVITFFTCSPPPVQASEPGAVVQVDYIALAIMLWDMKEVLPWYVLAPLVAWLLSPVFSLIVSITPTPKDDTAWAWIYKWLEINAFNFWKSKDKPVTKQH